MGERGRETETRAVRVCARDAEGMTKEGDKARIQRGLAARESTSSENMEGGKRGGAEDENSIRKIGKNDRKVRMADDPEKSRDAKNEITTIRINQK